VQKEKSSNLLGRIVYRNPVVHMKKVFLLWHVLVSLTVLLPCYLNGYENILENPGFEFPDGAADEFGWERRGPSTISLNRVLKPDGGGSYMLEIEGRGTEQASPWYGAKQDLTGKLAPTVVYEISGYVSLPTGFESDVIKFQLIKKLSDGSTVYQDIATGEVTSSSFSLLTGQFSIEETDIEELTLSIHGPSSGKPFLLDDFFLFDPSAELPDSDNLAPSSFVFKSVGLAGASGTWILDRPGFIGSFLFNQLDTPVNAVLRLELSGQSFQSELPTVEVFSGVTRETRPVTSSASYQYFYFTLPPGKHSLRICLVNPAPDTERSLTIHTAEVSGAGIIFDNSEANVLEAARNSFEYFRKSEFELKLYDNDGQVLQPGSVVFLEPVSHEFNFGVGVKGWNSNSGTADRRDWVDPTHPDYEFLKPVRDFVAGNFNTIVPNNAGKWSPSEGFRDSLDYSVLDLIQGFSVENELRLRMHAMAWPKQGGNPSWAMELLEQGLSGDVVAAQELRSEISERLSDYTTGRASKWIGMDCINEGYHEDGFLRLYGYEGVAGIYEESIDVLRAMGSDAVVYFNEFGTFNRFSDPYANWYVNHVHQVLSEVSPEKRHSGFGIGHQSYISDKPSQGSFLDPVTYYQVLQNTASLGLPLSITEFGVKQEPSPAPTYLQSAELLRQAMTIALGNDRVESFLVWNFLEGEMFTQATAAPMLEDSGDFQYTLTDFGRAWQHLTGKADHSELFPGFPRFAGVEQAIVDSDGILRHRGLRGRYRIYGDGIDIETDLYLPGEHIVNERPARNVLMIVVDDLKPLIGAYGDPIAITPRMDQLAADGVIFTNAHCQMAICAPSRASVLTGLRPDFTGVLDLQTKVRDVNPSVVTLPQHFANNGYTVHGISKIFHGTTLASQDGTQSWNDGWQAHGVTKRYYEPGKSEQEDMLRSQGSNNAANKLSATDRGIASDTDYGDGVAAQLGVSKIAEYAAAYRGTGTPFFLAVGFQKPHLPLNAPESYWALYDTVDFGMDAYSPTFAYPDGSPTYAKPFSGEPGSYGDGWPEGEDGIILAPDSEAAEHLVHAYYACVSFIDAQIGKLLDELESQGISDETIVLLWSDHGFHLGDHGAFWSKHSNYEQATRSVLMIKANGVATPGGVVEAPVELLDIFPTLCQLTDLPFPIQPDVGPLQGTGLEPVLRSPVRPWRKAAFSQYHRNPGGSLLMGYSMRTDRYRLTSWFPREVLDDPSTTGIAPVDEEFFDYQIAPDEPANLVGDSAYAGPLSALSAVMQDGRWDNQKVSVDSGEATLISPITNWKQAYFPLGVDESWMRDEADFDGDGLPTAMEYCLGLSPVINDFFPLINTTDQPNLGMLSVSLKFPKPIDRPDYEVFAQSSTDLINWSQDNIGFISEPDSEMVEARFLTPENRGFMRLQVRPFIP
jgi:arylsulfatase A-like enzyme/GH35 family endo-1,4-beta-xylanase